MKIMENICAKCQCDLITSKNLGYHKQFCGKSQFRRKSFSTSTFTEICNKCDEKFQSFNELIKHLSTCGKFLCYQCKIPFLSISGLQSHLESVHSGNKNKDKLYKCALCDHICKNRRELYDHRLIQHGGDDEELEDIPPYIFQDQNEGIKNTYITNRKHILAPDKHGETKHVYNFPTNNLSRGYREIRHHVTEIYREQHFAFRINLAFGMILHNPQTDEYRYYIPYYNSRILQYPFTISNRNGIRFLIHKLAGIDIIQQARTIRPSSSWTLAFITNVQYNVFVTDFPLGHSDFLPDYIVNNKYLKNMYINPRTKKPYYDNMCFFRCLRIHFKKEKTVNEYFNLWKAYLNQHPVPAGYSQFEGVTFNDMISLEKCFNVKIKFFSLNENDTISYIYETISDYTDQIYLNIYHSHLSYITNFKYFAKKFECSKCSKMFNREWNLRRHYKNCYERTKMIFPGGFYKTNDTIFEKIRSLGIDLHEDDLYCPYFAVWDMEAMLIKSQTSSNDRKLQWLAQHVPISVSIASNVKDFESPKCFVNLNTSELISDMMIYLQKISEHNAEYLRCKYEEVLLQLDQLQDEYQDTYSIDSNFESDESHDEDHDSQNSKLASHFYKTIENIKEEFDRYINQLPVIGFNSGKYDINLIKKEIMTYISTHNSDSDIFTIKRDNTYLSIATSSLKFLDMSNFLAAGCSYSKFLKAYGCEISKGIFPYEWLDSPEKLNYKCLPPPKDFYSHLNNSNPIQSEDDYNKLKIIWESHNMQTFKDYLIYYNNLDTAPFCSALKNFFEIYKSQGIDIFKEYITLPGVARKMLYNSTASNFALFNSDNADLYYTF